MLLLFPFLQWRGAVGKSPLKYTSSQPRSPACPSTPPSKPHTQISRARQLKVIRTLLEAPSIFIVREVSRVVAAFQEVMRVYDFSLSNLRGKMKYHPRAPSPSLWTLWRLGSPRTSERPCTSRITGLDRKPWVLSPIFCLTLPSFCTILG